MLNVEEIKNLKEKYNVTDDYMLFLLEEYPKATLEELDQVVKEVMTDLKERGVLSDFKICPQCQEKNPSDNARCSNCNYPFPILYDRNTTTVDWEKYYNTEHKSKIVIYIIAVVLGLDALQSIFAGFSILHTQNTIGTIDVMSGLFEFILIIGLLARAYIFYLITRIMLVLDIVAGGLTFSTLISIPATSYNYQGLTFDIAQALILIIVSLVLFTLLTSNKSYFTKKTAI